MSKKIFILLLFLIMLSAGLLLNKPQSLASTNNILSTHLVLQIGSRQALINGELFTLEVSPVVINGRVMMPLRFMAETLGFKVDFNRAENKITLSSIDKEAVFFSGKTRALINKKPVTLEAPLMVINGRTLIALHIFRDHLGALITLEPGKLQIEIRAQHPEETILYGQVVGVDLSKREILLWWGNRSIPITGLNEANMVGKITRLEQFFLRMPVAVWGLAEENRFIARWLFTGTNAVPMVKVTQEFGVVREVNLTNSLLLVETAGGKITPLRINQQTELLLDHKKATLKEFRKGNRVNITSYQYLNQHLAISVKGEKTSQIVLGRIILLSARELSLLLTSGETLKVKYEPATSILVDGKRVGAGFLWGNRSRLVNRKAKITGFFEDNHLQATWIEIIR